MHCELTDVDVDAEVETETDMATERDGERQRVGATTRSTAMNIFKVKTSRICSKQKSNKNTLKDTHTHTHLNTYSVHVFVLLGKGF